MNSTNTMISIKAMNLTREMSTMSRRCLSIEKIASTKRSKPFSWLGPVFFAGLSLTAAGLGAWQVQRYYWKVDLLDKISKRSHEEALMLRNKEEFQKLIRQSQEDRYIHDVYMHFYVENLF
ncbi:hypothetical protein EON65_10720 [archaeon]|nr:MAG: hypothetical protein EON65_10720 [archaeon]